MRYPIAIESGDSKHAYGVVVPDLPGCFSAGDTLDEALTNAREAILLRGQLGRPTFGRRECHGQGSAPRAEAWDPRRHQRRDRGPRFAAAAPGHPPASKPLPPRDAPTRPHGRLPRRYAGVAVPAVAPRSADGRAIPPRPDLHRTTRAGPVHRAPLRASPTGR